jgi:Na+-transporting methylmalonyl-CoA/oxaloacetate decarboxylase beta subunit
MQENKYSKMSLDELKAKEKTLKSATSVFMGVLMVLTFAVVFLGIRQGFSVFSVLPIAFLPLLLANISGLKKLQEEIKSRG